MEKSPLNSHLLGIHSIITLNQHEIRKRVQQPRIPTLRIRGLATLAVCRMVKHGSRGSIIHMLNPLETCVIVVMEEVTN